MLALGALSGLGYGLLGVGLVLAFRASRVLNLAHGQVGVFAAVLLTLMVEHWGAPYWAAFPVALAAGAVISAAIEVVVVRRLSRVPVLVAVVATLGVAEFLRFLGAAVAGVLDYGARVPQPAGVPAWDLGALRVTPASTAMLVLAPVAVATLALVLGRSDVGLRMRAAAANADGARLLGTPAGRLRALGWALAGALSAMTAILLLPAGGSLTDEALGPPLLIRALAAAAVAQMASIPIALAAGTSIGVLEAVVRWNAADGALGDVAVVAVLLAALAARPRRWLRGDPPGAWAAIETWPRLPAAARAVPLVRWAPAGAAVACLAAACLLPLVLQAAVEIRLAIAACLALVALSVWVVSGLAGELSLGQVGVAGAGAVASLTVAGVSPLLGLVAAGAVGAAVAVIVGVPAARAGPLGLATATLAVAFLAELWIFRHGWALGDATAVAPLALGPVSTERPGGSLLLSVLALAGALAVVSSLRHGPLGRRLVAARDNPLAARALGIDAGAARTDALAIGGAVAGVGGAMLAHVLGRVGASTFPVDTSLAVVAMAVVGGLAVAGGALLGALWIAVLPALVDLSSAALAATAFGWLVLLLHAPGGLAAVLAPLRRRALTGLLRLAGHDPALAAPPRRRAPAEGALGRALPAAGAASAGVRAPEPAGLTLERLCKRFGAVTAVDAVDLDVAAGEIVAVVGANGAGKTTLLDLVSGFERPDAGRVLLAGADITRLAPHARAARGLGRSFQGGALFSTMMVAEALRLAAERRPGPPREVAARADAMLELFGLGEFAEARVRTLSTGVRRLAELACVLTAQPRVLLLDEPSSGLAQAETAALAALLLRVRRELGIGMLLIEHDAALVAGVADRVLELREGRIGSGDSPDAATPAGALA